MEIKFNGFKNPKIYQYAVDDLFKFFIKTAFWISPLAIWKLIELFNACQKYIEPILKGLAG